MAMFHRLTSHAAARVLFLACVCFLATDIDARSQSDAVPGNAWQQLASPEQSGWSAQGLAAVGDYLDQIGSSSAMVVQHGVIVKAWGDTEVRSNLHSCRKSLLDALIGIAVAQGKINLDDTLGTLGIDDEPPSLNEVEKQATVRQLLEARSGVYHAAAYETKHMAAERPSRGSHRPGEFWYYNNWDFNTLGYIYEHATGLRIFDAFERQIAKPIGMQDFVSSNGHYETISASRFPAYVFDMSARDFARFALLYLRGGRWNGVQVVPEDWVKTSTHPTSDAPSGGYGYLWWTGASASGAPASIVFPRDSFWAEGHLGQYAVVLPSLDLVIVNRVVDGRRGERVAQISVSKRQVAHLVELVVSAAPKSNGAEKGAN
jgi:CubicO group peptidase (beta-lactamase class C family)